MDPSARRELILDAAVTLIVDSGHSSCTLEQVAAAAHVSKPLIYKYFPRREDLLRAVLEREFRILSRQGLDSIPRGLPVEKVIRATVANALRYYYERGPIVRLLSSDPAVADLARRGNNATRSNTSQYFIARFVEAYGVSEDVALIAVTMVINAPIHSIGRLRRYGVPAERTIEVWSEFIIGGWKALNARYGSAAKRPRDPARRTRLRSARTR
jgi:AcrR family transcriptional regulator